MAASCSILETGLVSVFSLTPQQVQRFVSCEKATHLLLSMNYRPMEDSFQTASELTSALVLCMQLETWPTAQEAAAWDRGRDSPHVGPQQSDACWDHASCR